jgi:GAF domain-containing protein
MNSDFAPRLDLEMSEFVRGLQRRHKLDVKEVLGDLTAGAVRFLPSAQHAGITVAVRGKVSTESCTGPFPAVLDEIQAGCGAGPCLSAARNDDVIRVDDVANDPRWPTYSQAVVERTPIRSVLSLGLVSDSPGVSALNVYAEKPHAFDVGITEAALTYAAYTAMAWTLARRDNQFHQALQSRDMIGQAKGMIMERFRIDAAQAFELLKRLSQSSNTPLATVAAELVEAERLEFADPDGQH